MSDKVKFFTVALAIIIVILNFEVIFGATLSIANFILTLLGVVSLIMIFFGASIVNKIKKLFK